MNKIQKTMEMCQKQLNLPQFVYIKQYLNGRYISDEMIDFYQIGFGSFYNYGHNKRLWITIPIKDINDNVIMFKLRKDPRDKNNNIKYIAHPKGVEGTIFGMKSLLETDIIAIVEGEMDRMILESQGIPTITATTGVQGFKKDWIFIFRKMNKVFIIFDNDEAGHKGTKKLGNMILEEYPDIKVYNCKLPPEVGEHGDITDLMKLSKGKIDIDKLLYKDSTLMKIEKQKVVEYKKKDYNEEKDGTLDIEKIKQIPIKQILEKRGIKVINNKFKIRNEKTASAILYEKSNTYYDFGDSDSGSSNIDLLMKLDNIDFLGACEILRN